MSDDFDFDSWDGSYTDAYVRHIQGRYLWPTLLWFFAPMSFVLIVGGLVAGNVEAVLLGLSLTPVCAVALGKHFTNLRSRPAVDNRSLEEGSP